MLQFTCRPFNCGSASAVVLSFHNVLSNMS